VQAKTELKLSGNGKQAGTAASLVGRTATSAHQAVDRLANAAPPVIDRVASGAHHTVDNVARRLKPAGAWLEGSAQKLQRRKISAIAAGTNYVQEHPFKVIGGAIALGILLGQLTRLIRNRD
jgi:ElaB/YqjD/DUF883 family membrane-anchored ribosome-binding protein